MPLTSTAIWPDLVAGRKARASEVEAKFDWIEGTLYSHAGGVQTDNSYDIGTAVARFRNGYFGTKLEIGGKTLTADGIGESVKGWVHMIFAGAATTTGMTIPASYNVSSVVYNSITMMTVSWTTAYANGYYANSCMGSQGFIYSVDQITTTSARFSHTNAGFGAYMFIISVGNQI